MFLIAGLLGLLAWRQDGASIYPGVGLAVTGLLWIGVWYKKPSV